MLTKDWDMPIAIQEAIRDHHKDLDDIEPESLTGILQISEYLTTQLGYSAITGAVVSLSPNLEDHVKENMEEYKVLIEDLPDEMEKAQSLYSAG